MFEFETELVDVIQRTHNVKSFRYKTHGDVDFQAGQFFMITIKIGSMIRTKHFSFSNSPTEKGYIEFTKKITTSDFSQALDRFKVGEWAKLRLPFGSFVLKEEYEKIAFLCGGIGITPVRSITKYVIDSGLKTDMVLLYGNRSSRDIAFREDFQAMQKESPKFKVVNILSEPESTWRGRTGHINARTIKEEIPDYDQRKFFICGPPSMVQTMVRLILQELRLPFDNISTENFNGYK